MASRKLLVAAALAALALGGCATYPEYGYNDYRQGYHGRGYYEGPSLGVGITSSDRDRYDSAYGRRYP